jgi:phage terminase large subunit-like protein
MEALWTLAPKDELCPKASYDPGRGITGKPPRLVFTSGPGKGSVITFATYKQGSTRIAGGEYQFVGMDEPPPEAMFGEVLPRVLRCRGDIYITMTPTPDMPAVGWLREKVEDDDSKWSAHNYGLKEENCWIEGNPAPFLAQAEIDEYAKGLLSVERAMRVEGAWEPMVEGRWLTNFGDENVFQDAPPVRARLAVGIDHGAAAGKQTAMVVAVDDTDKTQHRVWYLAETVSDGFTTPAQDAAAVLEMLQSCGLEYHHIDEWIGDRPTGENRYLVGKTNKDMRLQLARLLGVRLNDTKTIRTPKKWDGSVTYGLRLMNGLFGSMVGDKPAAIVHPRCERFIEFCWKFQGDRRDKLKDVGDAGRYATERLVQLPRAQIGRVYV